MGLPLLKVTVWRLLTWRLLLAKISVVEALGLPPQMASLPIVLKLPKLFAVVPVFAIDTASFPWTDLRTGSPQCTAES